VITNIPQEDPTIAIRGVMDVGENIVDEGGGTIGDSGWFVDEREEGMFKIDVSKFIGWWMSVSVKEVQIKIACMDACFIFRLDSGKCSLKLGVEKGNV
jgi:hypothetical protein